MTSASHAKERPENMPMGKERHPALSVLKLAFLTLQSVGEEYICETSPQLAWNVENNRILGDFRTLVNV